MAQRCVLVLMLAAGLYGCSIHGRSPSSTAAPPARASSLSPEAEAFLGIGQATLATKEALASVPVSITTPYYSLSATGDLRADAELLAATLDAAIARLVTDYAAADADRLLRTATVRIRVASTPDETCGPGLATNRSSWDGARCTSEIHVLAPSAHPEPTSHGSPRTSMGEPMDEVYLQRVLVHEYATVLLDSICRCKPRGWSFWEAPAWFVQGSEEYLGVMYSTDHARRITLRKYMDETRARSLVSADWGLDARSPYVSGPVLVAFIHEQFGREVFVAILRSEQPTFGTAMRETLGVMPDEFHAAFAAWLSNPREPLADP